MKLIHLRENQIDNRSNPPIHLIVQSVMRLIPRFKNLITSNDTQPIKKNMRVIVSGLPRSGTSMMMKILAVGGLPPLTDTLREADIDNPQGYYEFEQVKQLDKGDAAWLVDAHGKTVKVIAPLLFHLPAQYHYQILFINRNINEVLASQRKMLEHRNEAANDVSDELLASSLQQHVQQVKSWIAEQPNMQLLNLDYNTMLLDPMPQSNAINQFLGGDLDEQAMIRVINPMLYRNRS